MAASVLLVQRVAQHFGLAVDRRALALCAVMALIVNFSAILLSVYLTFNHLLMLVFMVIGSAALVTGVNEYLLRRDYARVAFAGGDAKEKEVGEPETEPEIEMEQKSEPDILEPKPIPEEKIIWEVELPPDAVAPEPEPVAEEPTPEPEPEPVVEEPTPEPEPEPVAEESESELEPEEEEPSFMFELPDDLSTLDDYLDYAYAEKDAGHTAIAAAAYQKAIDGFPDDPYLPFLVIELGNLYKEAGAYDVAADTYRDALSLPVIQGQNGIVDEFKKTIAYLEAVSHITNRHDAPEIPFSQIPPDWLAEIEESLAKQSEH